MRTSRQQAFDFRRRAAVAALVLISSGLPTRRAAAQNASTARGVSLFQAADYPAARRELELVLRQNPGDATALFYMGRIALQEDRSSEAVDWLEKAVKIDEGKAEYHVYLGSALGDEAQRASKFRQPFLARRVKTEFERAVALDPRSVEARYGLIQVYALLPGFMGGDMAKAHEQAAVLATFNPYHGLLVAGFLAQREKDLPAAAQAYERAIALAPDSTGGYSALGAVLQREEKWAEALAVFDRRLARAPNDTAVLFQIGRNSALSGLALERGEQALKRWLAAPPRGTRTITLAGAHHRLGQVYEKQGRRDAARAEYEEALRINPKNEDARKSRDALAAQR
jgi:tetratricopeptide (TPR) repeat protein